MDFFTVPTVTGRILFVFVVLLHHRRRIVHFNVTEHPTAAWTAQQVVEAFPDDKERYQADNGFHSGIVSTGLRVPVNVVNR
jgi:hypothetical protein